MDEVTKTLRNEICTGTAFLSPSSVTLCYFAKWKSQKSPWSWKLWNDFHFGFLCMCEMVHKNIAADYMVAIHCSDQECGSSCASVPAVARGPAMPCHTHWWDLVRSICLEAPDGSVFGVTSSPIHMACPFHLEAGKILVNFVLVNVV